MFLFHRDLLNPDSGRVDFLGCYAAGILIAATSTKFSSGILHHRREVCSDHYRQLQAAEVLSKLSTMNDKSSFVKFLLVITKQLKLYTRDF
jgi:hypothetical protein